MINFSDQNIFKYQSNSCRKSQNRGVFSLDILDQLQQFHQKNLSQYQSNQELCSQQRLYQNKQTCQCKNQKTEKTIQPPLKISKINQFVKAKQVNISSFAQKIRKNIINSEKKDTKKKLEHNHNITNYSRKSKNKGDQYKNKNISEFQQEKSQNIIKQKQKQKQKQKSRPTHKKAKSSQNIKKQIFSNNFLKQQSLEMINLIGVDLVESSNFDAKNDIVNKNFLNYQQSLYPKVQIQKPQTFDIKSISQQELKSMKQSLLLSMKKQNSIQNFSSQYQFTNSQKIRKDRQEFEEKQKNLNEIFSKLQKIIQQIQMQVDLKASIASKVETIKTQQKLTQRSQNKYFQHPVQNFQIIKTINLQIKLENKDQKNQINSCNLQSKQQIQKLKKQKQNNNQSFKQFEKLQFFNQKYGSQNQQQYQSVDQNQYPKLIRKKSSISPYLLHNLKGNYSQRESKISNDSKIQNVKFMNVTLRKSNNMNNMSRNQIKLGRKKSYSTYKSVVTKRRQISLKPTIMKFNKQQNNQNSQISQMKKSRRKIIMTINGEHLSCQRQKSRDFNFSSERKSSRGIRVLSKSMSQNSNTSVSKIGFNSKSKDRKLLITQIQIPIRQINQFDSSYILNSSQKPNLLSNEFFSQKKNHQKEKNDTLYQEKSLLKDQNNQNFKKQIQNQINNPSFNVMIKHKKHFNSKEDDKTKMERLEKMQKFSSQLIKKPINIQQKVKNPFQKINKNQTSKKRNTNPIMFYQQKRINKKVQ